jgi:vacuolar protein sorting-associated protein 13A/C
MSLTRMGKPSESVRFLDDVDLTVSLDTRMSASQQMTSLEISAKPIVFRASYRDITLITNIVNKAITLYAKSTQSRFDSQSNESLERASKTLSRAGSSRKQSFGGQAQVVMTREQVRLFNHVTMCRSNVLGQLKGSFDGFRLVLIGDLHEQPMLHLRVKPFIIGAKDWSGEVRYDASSLFLRDSLKSESSVPPRLSRPISDTGI